VRSCFHELEVFVILFRHYSDFFFILMVVRDYYSTVCIPYVVIFVTRRLLHLVSLSVNDILSFSSLSVYAGIELQDLLNCFDHSSGPEYMSAY